MITPPMTGPLYNLLYNRMYNLVNNLMQKFIYNLMGRLGKVGSHAITAGVLKTIKTPFTHVNYTHVHTRTVT